MSREFGRYGIKSCGEIRGSVTGSGSQMWQGRPTEMGLSVDDRPSPHTESRARQVRTTESAQYEEAVGVTIQSVRSDSGPGASEVTSIVDDRFTFTASKVGFATFSRATVDDDTLIVAYIRSAPPGCRWCDIDLEPGSVLVYGPSSQHAATNLPGLDFIFATTKLDHLAGHADQIGVGVELPSAGEVRLLNPAMPTDPLTYAFPAVAQLAAAGRAGSNVIEDGILRSMAHALAPESRAREIGGKSRIGSCHVTNVCVDYAQSIGRIPSISELCLVAHVSERRLRKAFSDVFGTPPSSFFRAWALDEAHRRLLSAEAGHDTVTQVASNLGFLHLGRFASYYRTLYGEPPVTTLRT